MSKYGFVYIWFDRKHKRYYIGCHWGNINDRYICSSDWMRNAYRKRPLDFKRRILVSAIQSRDETLEQETKWLSQIKDEELGKRYYNLNNKAFSHWSIDRETRLRVGKTISIKNKGKHNSPITEIKKGERRSPQTEFKPNQLPHNKGKALEDIVGVERATEIKLSKSQRYKGKSFSPNTQFAKGQNTGIDNPKARKISTPHGIFATLTDATKTIPISMASLHYKLRTAHQSDWHYL